MATLAPSRRSSPAASSSSSDRPTHARPNDAARFSPLAAAPLDDASAADIPVEVLVEHLLAAKRSLSSSMTLVLRANDVATAARQAHEESVILSAQSEFLRRSISDQTVLLARIRRGLQRTYDFGRRDFKHLVKQMDASDERLQGMMDGLRSTPVEDVFRPPGETAKNLLDFLDEQSVLSVVEALKRSLGELQAIQTSFDGDLLRFDTDIRALKKSMSSSPSPPSPSASARYPPIPHLLASLVDHSHMMAQLLTSLTKHFDLCVTAVRATDGGADLARRLAAAESSQPPDGSAEAIPDVPGVSISGVIAEQETHLTHLDPRTSQERADMVRVVVEDAAEVDDVVREIAERLSAMEADAGRLDEQAEQARAAHAGTAAAFRALEDIGGRVAGYVAAEAEFLARWEDEREVVFTLVREMEGLRDFYEKYSSAYGSLLLEVERRRGVEERIQTIWRKARDNVDKLVEADRREREAFQQDAGEYLPTDLWHGINAPLRRWEVIQARGEPAGE